jgi:hypothetical protein
MVDLPEFPDRVDDIVMEFGNSLYTCIRESSRGLQAAIS